MKARQHFPDIFGNLGKWELDLLCCFTPLKTDLEENEREKTCCSGMDLGIIHTVVVN